jgi:transcriptional regulator with XRE-family HTH domain
MKRAFREAIGRKICELREAQNMTTTELAKKAGISQAQISRLENGLQGFRSATLIKFSKALGVPPIYFFVEGEDTSTAKVADALESYGLTPSRGLRKALSNPAFLKFAEKCAKSFRAAKKNLLKMEAVIKHVL